MASGLYLRVERIPDSPRLRVALHGRSIGRVCDLVTEDSHEQAMAAARELAIGRGGLEVEDHTAGAA